MGNNAAVYQFICIVIIILFVFPNVEHLRKKYPQ